MKMKKKAVIAAAAFAVAMNLSACAYGPPDEDFDQDMPTEETSFAPDENQNVGVYGPPPEEYEDTPQTEEISSFDPAENQTVGVYGPPGEEWDYGETDTSEEEQDVGEEALNNE